MTATLSGSRPDWLTFDCYGTLAQWDEGLVAVVEEILSVHGRSDLEPATFIEVYDRWEHEAEQAKPFRNFKTVSAYALEQAMRELGMDFVTSDAELLVSRISSFPPFAEVPETLAHLRELGFKLCIISNTDDDLIEGNVRQMGGDIGRVISAEQARAYKPSSSIFQYAYDSLGVGMNDVVHVCASPHLDLAAARDMGFRCIWVDRATARQPLPDYTPDATVTSLDQVLDVFRRSGWA